MRAAFLLVAASALWLAGAPAASARVELGRPEFSNYMAPYGLGTCDWWTSAWLRACPGVLAAPAAAAPAAVAPAAVKVKKTRAAKPAQ
jgi:hypothetical protein